jgi:hypothetical protein
LEGIGLDEGHLQGMEPFTLGKTLNGQHLLSCQAADLNPARPYRFTIYNYGTGAAFAGLTSTLGTGEAEMITEKAQQGKSLISLRLNFLVI